MEELKAQINDILNKLSEKDLAYLLKLLKGLFGDLS